MGGPKLANYVQQQLKAGYDINAIRNFLIRNGYDKRDIDAAVDYIYKKPEEKNYNMLAIAGVLLIIIISVSVFFFFKATKQEAPTQLLDIETTTIAAEVIAGNALSFNVQLTNMGSAKRYDVQAVHELVDSIGNTIATKQETIALETRVSKSSQILVPSDAVPGTYTLKTTANYNGQKANSVFTIKIKEKTVIPETPATPVTPETPATPEVPEKQCPDSCDDFDKCTTDSCGAGTSFECVHMPITPCCGNNVCEPGEGNDNCPADCREEGPVTFLPGQENTVAYVVNKAKEIAASSAPDAANYCSEQEQQNFKDNCYKAVAEAAKDSSYCTIISSDGTRDSCYTTAALNWKDFTVCEKMTDKYLKIACNGYANSQAATS